MEEVAHAAGSHNGREAIRIRTDQAVWTCHAMRRVQADGRDGSDGGAILDPTPEIIRVERAFTLFAESSVEYNGRAKSVLDKGRFLLIHKSDGTLLIHADSLCTPRNYQGPGAILKRVGNKLISTRKDETITVDVSEVLAYTELPSWATHKTAMSKTERELKEYIATHINEFFDGTIKEVHVEFQIPVGFIDVLAIDEADHRHIIEVKRKTVGVTTVYQVQRYMDYFNEISVPAFGYTAGPGISKNAALQLEKKGYQHLLVQHHTS